MDPAQERAIEKLLEKVEKPARYTGGEMNTQVRPWNEAEMHFAFCFADTYEIGMSYLGMKILVSLINSLPYMSCERVFMPWVDFRAGLKEKNIPLFSLESRKALSEFDVIGFSLQYEMSYTNILDMLDLGGVPVLAADRKELAPIVMGGAGKKRTPALAARYADEFNVPFMSAEDTAVLFERVAGACRDADRDPATLTYSNALVLCCGRDEAEIARRAERIGREVGELRENGLAGTPEEVVEKIKSYAAVGSQRVYLQMLDLSDLEHLELVAAEVMPAVRDL